MLATECISNNLGKYTKQYDHPLLYYCICTSDLRNEFSKLLHKEKLCSVNQRVLSFAT